MSLRAESLQNATELAHQRAQLTQMPHVIVRVGKAFEVIDQPTFSRHAAYAFARSFTRNCVAGTVTPHAA